MVLNLQTLVAYRSEAHQAEKAKFEKKECEHRGNGGNCFHFILIFLLLCRMFEKNEKDTQKEKEASPSSTPSRDNHK